MTHHHSPEENQFTARLVADLKAAGADVWVDDEGITSGDFVRKINEGLVGRQWLVLVMTPGALQSPWVRAEVDAALHQHMAGHMLGIIPFVAQVCDEHLIPPLWANLHAMTRHTATYSVRSSPADAAPSGFSSSANTADGRRSSVIAPSATPAAFRILTGRGLARLAGSDLAAELEHLVLLGGHLLT
jgi:hypothetical protein